MEVQVGKGADMIETRVRMDECVGNSHALIEYQRSSSTADCVCGNALILVKGERFGRVGLVWVHGVNWSGLCPPYECDCGQRHNRRSPSSPRPRA